MLRKQEPLPGSEVEMEYLQRHQKGFRPAVFRTCEGDLILTINALIDYAGICDKKADEMEQPFEAASLRYYADRFRRIADKWSKEIGFDREKAIRICERNKKRRKASDDYGEDALALAAGATAKQKEEKNDGT